jgi:TonB family protein
VSAPIPVFTPDPEYSDEARREKYQGTVVLWVVIGPDGVPQHMRVQRSLGMGLDEKAMEAVKTWRFKPAMRNGQPVPVEVSVEVSFRLL